MPLVNYAPRVSAHPTRTGAHRSNPPRLLIIHTSEGGELPTSADALARFIASPRSATNLASYHYIASTNRVIPLVPDDYVAFANAGANTQGLSICHPGRAAQTTDLWFDVNSGAQLEQVARWLADKCAEYDIPCRKLDWEQVRAGAAGICGHVDVTLAFERSSHTDPGRAYPWAWVIARAHKLSAPVTPPPPPHDEEDDMFISVWPPDGSWWLISDGLTRRVQISHADAVKLVDSGAVKRHDIDPELLPRTGPHGTFAGDPA